MNKERQMEEKNLQAKEGTYLDIESSKEQKLQEIITERVTQQIEDDLTALRNQKCQTPLSFYLRIGDTFCFSFNKSKVPVLLGRYFLYLPIFAAQMFAVLWISNIPQMIQNALVGIFLTQLVLYTMLFCLDPGTLIEDEQEKCEEDRYLCQNCRLYKYQTTRHCVFCQKCVKGYDHHCSFFGKCIGKRNFIIFCLFIILSMSSGVGAVGSVAYTILSKL